ncbi:SulP family inorganic anion transporter [Acidiferrimicrobium sp. IK]|uniref:SulP family inorganic anion transporter n=1 Tax=Acidiferrimicrobium sp. IK TaxID=2871700 RepID=UPI0021CB3E97|nr:SulP family inorganic anion transporter [Acidiferrimicrobium sp. IK]MCU4183508.1 SulP family inorganic anion transporter [Acidiferrimicrobium sp. IK]
MAQARTPTDRDGSRIPEVFSSLRGYQASWAGPDAIAGVTLLVIAVPEQIATSRLAGMPPITGLYAFVAGTVLFALVGRNPRMSVGADSTIAPLFALGVAQFAPAGTPRYVALVGLLAVLVGALVAAVGLLRLGWLAEFLSAPIITGFLAGIAVVIVIHQLPDLLGIPSSSGSNLHRVGYIATHLDGVNGWSAGIGVAVLAAVVGAERVDRRIPGALVGLLASTIVVAAAGLRGHGVAVLGHVVHGAPRWGLAGLSWSAVRDTAPIAGVVALVVISQSAATARAFPGSAEYQEDTNRDFVAVGAGSIVAGLAGAFPVNASPPRTAAVASAGGRSQAAGLGAAAAVVLLVPAARLLTDVPVATLAGVLIFVAARIFRVGDLVAVLRFDYVEFALAVVTLLTVALVGVEQGIGVAVGLAILDRTRLSARPQLHVLGRIPGTTSWAPLSGVEHAAQVPGVLVVLFATPLWYANAVHFRAELQTARLRVAGTLHAVVLDAIGMSDIDYTGAKALAEALDDLDEQQIGFAIARAGEHVRVSLERSGLLARIGEDHLYPAVDEAVTALTAGGAPRQP